jgi:hypothetical protein
MENLNLKYEILNYYFRSIKDFIKTTIIQGTWKILITKTFPKCFPWYQCYYIILPLSSLLIRKTLYEGAWSPYSLIMDCYIFLATPLKVHYVMII